MNKRRILILTADAGYGHRSAANAIAAALEELYGNQCEYKIVNPMEDEDTPNFIQQFEQNYDENVTKNPEFYRLSYHALDAPLISDVAKKVVARLLNGVMYETIKNFRPDAIVSTYLFYAKAVSQVTEELKMDCPLAIVITDLTDVQNLWFSTTATMHFVPTQEIREQAYANNVPAPRVKFTGLPVHPEIAKETRSRTEIRKELGWKQRMPTCLVVSGPRTQKTAEISQALDQIPGLQVVVVCGGDKDLYDELKQHEWQGTVHIYDWVDQMPRMFKAADFMVSKAGGLVVSEALASGLPMIIPEALPGQETGNKEFVVKNKAGIWAPDMQDISKAVKLWLENGRTRLKKLQSNAQKLGKPQAAYEIARVVWGLTGGEPG